MKIKADIALDKDNNVLEIHKQIPKKYLRIEIEENKIPDLSKFDAVYDEKKNKFISKVKSIKSE
ncbi:unnamed protein product [marine sediment metagenome]|uniref:Uncharacterized protein n=1 Tax=marine sediment metagenome TaxID=412755 RepID=X1K0G1_9ZZZZ